MRLGDATLFLSHNRKRLRTFEKHVNLFFGPVKPERATSALLRNRPRDAHAHEPSSQHRPGIRYERECHEILQYLLLSQVGLICCVRFDLSTLGYLVVSDLDSCMQIVTLARVSFTTRAMEEAAMWYSEAIEQA